jgi:hypothetical protein
MTRIVAIALVLLWIQPAEAGWPFRRKPTAAEQLRKRQRDARAAYGEKAFRKQVNEGRSRKLKPPQVRAKASR